MIQVYTESEAAAQLRISPVTLGKLAREGRIGYVVGGSGQRRQHRRYTQAHLDAYLKAESKAAEQQRTTELLAVAKASLRATTSTVGRYSREALVARGLLPRRAVR